MKDAFYRDLCPLPPSLSRSLSLSRARALSLSLASLSLWEPFASGRGRRVPLFSIAAGFPSRQTVLNESLATALGFDW